MLKEVSNFILKFTVQPFAQTSINHTIVVISGHEFFFFFFKHCIESTHVQLYLCVQISQLNLLPFRNLLNSLFVVPVGQKTVKIATATTAQ